MPGVICYRARPQDCALLGHLYRSSPNAAGARPVRAERQSLRQSASKKVSGSRRHGLEKSPSPVRVSLPLLLFLSPEVVLLVLAELPGRDILRCRLVCKLLKQFIDHSVKLRYIAEAHARGLEPLQNSNSAQQRVSRLLLRERTWATFGTIPGTHVILDPRTDNDDNDDEDPRPVERVLYDWGRAFVCRGSRVSIHSLDPGITEVRERIVPGLRNAIGDGVIAFGDRIAFSVADTVCVYSLGSGEIARILHAPRRGTIGALRVQGDLLVALFCPERQCSGVLAWDWNSGKLIDMIHSIGSPTLSFTFLNHNEISVVRTNRSARSARIDTYAITSSSAVLRSSLALPDAHPTKWYARANIHSGGSVAPSGCESIQHDQGVIAIDIKLRIRSPHDPATTATNRKLSVILVVHKQALVSAILASPSLADRTSPIPWSLWSSDRFRVLSNVRVASEFPVWGNRVIATGPEPDQLALFDFCSVGAKAASRVWKAPGTWGGSSMLGNGGVSVRAALAQRARTLVRAGSLGVGAGWFEGMGASITGALEQMPYVVSVRRGMGGVESVGVDGERVVALRNEMNLEGVIELKATSFVFSV